MTNFAALLQQGASHAWLFIPSAVLLGALHGLEPGHSKTMMAAFIVAIRGTVSQAVLLGLAATISHTAIVWIVALAGLQLGANFYTESTEGYFQMASAVMIVGIAIWMLVRTYRDRQVFTLVAAPDDQHRKHDHDHGHAHDHDHAKHHDAHEREHAEDIRRRFATRKVTTRQIIIFGLTGGLVPCPASITVLLLCLQLKRVSLGAVLVLCFSIGLALTMVTSGTLAALSVRHVSSRWTGFGRAAQLAPYVSGALIMTVGLYTGYTGWAALS
jgi:ABC-type nickel/cobalt efflux system permease component RcnA